LKRVKFNLKKAADYKTIPVNGAWGSVAVHGNIAVDLYVERTSSPEFIEHQMVGDGLGPEETSFSSDIHEVDRVSQVGMLLTPSAARAIGQWLIEKADEVDRLTKLSKPDLNEDEQEQINDN
jgi:hypothetical protein